MITETTETQTQLAGVRVPCGGCPDCNENIHNPPQDIAARLNIGCQGQPVYLFPAAVRVPCVRQGRWECFVTCYVGFPQKWPECDCQGRGWNVSQNGWVWWRAAHHLSNLPSDGTGELVFTLSLQIGGPPYVWAESGWGNSHHYSFTYDSSNEHEDPEAAFFTALWQAVNQIPGRVFDA